VTLVEERWKAADAAWFHSKMHFDAQEAYFREEALSQGARVGSDYS
jgi:hypothetical protein